MVGNLLRSPPPGGSGASQPQDNSTQDNMQEPPVVQQPVGQQPVGQQPVGQQPVGQQPVGQQLVQPQPLLPSAWAGTERVAGSYTPAAQQNGKRPRTETPDKVFGGVAIACKIAEVMEATKGQIGKAALNMQNTQVKTINGLRDAMYGFLNTELVAIFEMQATMLSDIAMKMSTMEETVGDIRENSKELKEEIVQVKVSKDRVEVKASAKEMEAKVKLASTQFKVMDLDLGTAHKDRKELTEAAKKALADKVRSDLRQGFNDKVKKAIVTVLAKQTVRRKKGDQDIWTAPVLVQIEDRETRWNAEDALRKSNVHPTFHWPKEMLDDVRTYRKTVQDMGFGEDSHYIRIRPEERDNQWRIKAEVKKKDSDDRFKAVANFAIPPLDNNVRALGPDWYKPTWMLTTRNRLRSMARKGRRGSMADRPASQQTEEVVMLDMEEEDLTFNI